MSTGAALAAIVIVCAVAFLWGWFVSRGVEE